MSKKRKWLWAILTLVIAVLTVRTVFSFCETLSPKGVVMALGMTSPTGLALTLLCMCGFIVFEGLALLCILRHLGYPHGFLQGMLYSASDQFFSAITPSATGGQPASALFMHAQRIPAAVITTALLFNLILYTLATLLIGAVSLIGFPGVFLRFDTLSRALIVFGMVVLTGLALLFYGLLRRGETLFRLGSRILELLGRIHLLRDPSRRIKRLHELVGEYRECADTAGGNRKMLATAFVFNLLQRLSQIAVTPVLYIAMGQPLGGKGADLWVIQALSQIGSNCVPIPGGMGAADYLMLDGLQTVFSKTFAYQLQILGRGLSFYCCTLLAGAVTLAGYVIILHQKRKQTCKTMGE